MSAQSAGSAGAGSTELVKRRGFTDIMQEIFLPVMPALIASGILQGVVSILVAFHLLTEGDSLHKVLSTTASAVIYFLPFLLAPSTAKAFGASPYLAIASVAFFMSPEIVAMMESPQDISLLGIPVVKTTYTSSVIPIILMIWGMSYIQRWLTKVTPKLLATVLVPPATVALTTIVGLLVLGPIGDVFTRVMVRVINTLQDASPVLVPVLVGMLGAVMVAMGLSLSLVPAALTSMSLYGYDNVYGPGMLASNMALAGMAAAVALRSRDQDYKAFSLTASATALLGVAQPALYGVGLVLRRPFLAVMTGGAVGGLVIGLTGFKVYSLSPAGLTSIAGWLGNDGSGNLLYGLMASAIAFAVSFVVAWVLGFDQPSREVIDEVTASGDA